MKEILIKCYHAVIESLVKDCDHWPELINQAEANF